MAIVLDGTLGITSVTGSSSLCVAGPAFSVGANATSQGIPTGTTTVINLNSKTFDTNTCFNNTGSTTTLNGLSVPAYSFCPNVAGYYQINGCIQGPSSSTGIIVAYLIKNGSIVNQGNFLNTTVSAQALVSSVIYLNGTGDYAQLGMFQNLGSTSTIATGNSTTFIYMNGSMVRSA